MEKKNVFEMVTNRIISQLEKGIIPWQRPWGGLAEGAISHETGEPYSLLNQMLLGRDGEWLTFKQIQNEGGRIKKGEEGSIVVFWKPIINEVENEDGTKTIDKYFVLKYYHVWHLEQCEGIKAKFTELKPRTTKTDAGADELVRAYVERECIHLLTDQPSNRAYYSPTQDKIVVPMVSQFDSTAEYYSTLFHEMTHSTGHAKRLNRLHKTAAFGDESYSKEELVAEMGAAYLCTMIGIETDKAFRNSVAYVQNWLRHLRKDSKLVVYAAGKADAAVRYILNGKEKKDA